MTGSTNNGGSSGGLWIALGLVAAAATVGGFLAYNAGKDEGRREGERNSITTRDAESFKGAAFQCRPCERSRTLSRAISEGGNPAGKFWTPEDISTMVDPADYLALPPGTGLQEIFEGQFGGEDLCCEGIVAAQPEWGRSGGAPQVVVIRRDR